MNKNFLLTLFLILFVSFSKLSAQNWLPAFVIVNETDTLFGEVDFRISRLNQESALFRKDRNSPVTVFSPEEIIGYRFTPDGKYFVSRTIKIDDEPRLVFVEFMVKGMMNLYYFVDENRQEYFFFENENGELFAITREKDRVYGRYVKRDNKFDRLIRYRFQDYSAIAFNPNKYEFNQASMIDVVRTYHKLTCLIGEECIVFENKKTINTRFSAYTAIEIYEFGFNNLALGVETEFISSQLSRHFGLYADASISRINQVWDSAKFGKDISNYTNIHVDVYPLTARAGIRYGRPIKNFTPTARLGFSYKHLFGNIETEFFRYYDDDELMLRKWEDYVMNYAGIHIALGSEYRLSRSNALSLQFVFDGYSKNNIRNRPPIFASSFATYGVRLGYVF